MHVYWPVRLSYTQWQYCLAVIFSIVAINCAMLLHILCNLCRITMFSFHRSWSWRLLNQGKQMATYDQFRVAWLAFTSIMDVPDQYFQCPVCKQEPRVMICDGICLSYPKKFMQNPQERVTMAPPLEGSR